VLLNTQRKEWMQESWKTEQRRRGFTLIEIIITVAIAAIVLATAAPAFAALLDKQRLIGAASRLGEDIRFARAEAARRGVSVRLSVHGTHSGCYLLHTGTTAACNCTDDGIATCSGGAEALKTVGLGSDSGLRLSSSVISTVFDSLHGTNSPAATLTVTANSGRSIRQVISIMGRVRTCSPSTAAPAVPGYAIC
jgi:type IV fimbrial biogenesis protein FimT